MKTFKIVLLTVITFLSFAACDNDEPKNEPAEQETETKTATYIGLLSVDQNDGTFYEQKNTEITTEITENNTLNFTMLKVKFSERMPITLDMTVSGIGVEKTENGLILSGNNIIPNAMGGEFPNYTMTNIIGTITDEKFEISMMCGTYPLTFSGVVQKK